MKWLISLMLVLALVGIFDASYLTYEHFANSIPPCSTSVLFLDCGSVLKSQYAVIYGVPLALIGAIHYSVLTLFLLSLFIFAKKTAAYGVVILSTVGFLSSLYFVYLQLIIIKAICFYCMISAVDSLLIFILAQVILSKDRKKLCVYITKFLYQQLLKPVFFNIDPETIHTVMCKMGELLGSVPFANSIMHFFWVTKNKALTQTIFGIHFENPIGLAAGFDYEARLTQTLPGLGFGFETVGTVTNHQSEGNPKPRLGRLPKSKSLMVNKGFRNPGAAAISKKLSPFSFAIPVGISVGRTNAKNMNTLSQSIADILSAFKTLESAKLKNAYYELNISCPNLFGDINFYPPKNLEMLLTKIDALKLSKPLFIKMPIEKSDREVLAMLAVIARHSPKGVIFGNLQKDRHNNELDQSEVSKFSVGNFSGKPTFQRSNELIALAYKKYRKRFVIIGCGGIFSAQDAYKKITLGASLVQLITGMIYEGPQLIAQINSELPDFLKADGFSHISEAIGSRNRLRSERSN